MPSYVPPYSARQGEGVNADNIQVNAAQIQQLNDLTPATGETPRRARHRRDPTADHVTGHREARDAGEAVMYIWA
jgi:hypothetical protein